MAQFSRIALAWKALRELGLARVSYYAMYQAMLRSGYLSWATRHAQDQADGLPALTFLRPVLVLPDRERLRAALGDGGQALLRHEADEILSGWVRLFGGGPVPLKLAVPKPLQHGRQPARHPTVNLQVRPEPTVQ